MNNDEALKIYFENLLSYVNYDDVVEDETLDKDTIETRIDKIELSQELLEEGCTEDLHKEFTSFVIEDHIPDPIMETDFPEKETLVETSTSEPLVESSASEPLVETSDSELLVETPTSEPLVQSSASEPLVESDCIFAKSLYFYSILSLSFSIFQRKNSHFLSSNSESSAFEHLSLILDFSNDIRINYTVPLNVPFDKIVSISNSVSILNSYIIFDNSSKNYVLNIKGVINKNLSLLYKNLHSDHIKKIPFNKKFNIEPSRLLPKFAMNKPVTIYPFNKRFLNEHKLCMNISNSTIKESFNTERKS